MNRPAYPVTDLAPFAATCFSLARAAATCIDLQILKGVSEPRTKKQAKALSTLLWAGEVFGKDILVMLYDLINLLDAEAAIAAAHGLNCREHRSGGNAATQPDLTDADAQRREKAIGVLVELYVSLSTVHDILRAEKALTGLRAIA